MTFSFSAYVASLDKNSLDNLIKSFGHGVADTIQIGERVVHRREFVKSNPKLALWLTAAEVIACLHLEIEIAKLHLQKLALAEYVNLTAR